MSLDPIDRPHDWHDAFAALPSAEPPPDGWARVSAALDATVPKRTFARRRTLPLALAATLALLAPVLALRLLDGAQPGGSTSEETSPLTASIEGGRTGTEATEPSRRESATAEHLADPGPDDSRRSVRDRHALAADRERDGGVGDRAAARGVAHVPSAGDSYAALPSPGPDGRQRATPSPHAAQQTQSLTHARSTGLNDVAKVSERSADSTVLAPASTTSPRTRAGSTASADAYVALESQAPHRVGPAQGDPVAPTAIDPLHPLYAEAAQLEALLALTRDDRVASASGAVLSDALAERLAAIDFELARPALPDAHRAALWRERVAELRQLAGIESTERWLAVHGRAYGDAFVRID